MFSEIDLIRLLDSVVNVFVSDASSESVSDAIFSSVCFSGITVSFPLVTKFVFGVFADIEIEPSDAATVLATEFALSSFSFIASFFKSAAVFSTTSTTVDKSVLAVFALALVSTVFSVSLEEFVSCVNSSFTSFEVSALESVTSYRLPFSSAFSLTLI